MTAQPDTQPDPVLAPEPMTRTIRCNTCAQDKPEGEFSFKSVATGRRNTKCKLCMRAYSRRHHAANKATINPKIHARNKETYAATRHVLAEATASLRCGDCSCAGTASNDLIVRTSIHDADPAIGGRRAAAD